MHCEDYINVGANAGHVEVMVTSFGSWIRRIELSTLNNFIAFPFPPWPRFSLPAPPVPSTGPVLSTGAEQLAGAAGVRHTAASEFTLSVGLAKAPCPPGDSYSRIVGLVILRVRSKSVGNLSSLLAVLGTSALSVETFNLGCNNDNLGGGTAWHAKCLTTLSSPHVRMV